MSEQTTVRGAPGELELVRRFVNSVDVEAEEDSLSTPAEAARWLRDHRLLTGRGSISAGELNLLLRSREAIRGLALANNEGAAVARAAATTLNRITKKLRLTVSFDQRAQGVLRPASSGAVGAIARMLGIIYTAMADGTWTRLKACRRDTCHWLFYDHSKNRSSRWCHMSICGNREKAKSYRARHRNVSRK